MLCVCNMDIQFTYVHAGWEGSANDSRVLEEAIGDRKHGFHGHQQVLSITVTLTKVILSSIVSSMFMNNLIAYWLVVCVCRVVLLGRLGPTNWH